jgi:exoribonuclease R
VKGNHIFIPGGRYYSNRAIDGDLVAVQVLPESQWKSPSRRVSPSGKGQLPAPPQLYIYFWFVYFWFVRG